MLGSVPDEKHGFGFNGRGSGGRAPTSAHISCDDVQLNGKVGLTVLYFTILLNGKVGLTVLYFTIRLNGKVGLTRRREESRGGAGIEAQLPGARVATRGVRGESHAADTSTCCAPLDHTGHALSEGYVTLFSA